MRGKDTPSAWLTAWTEDMMSYHGKYWQIPVEGTPWDIEATRRYGAGLSDDNIVQAPGVVPKPCRSRARPSSSPSNRAKINRWCAKEEVTAILPDARGLQNQLYDAYREEAGKLGRLLPRGQGLGVVRDVIICDTDKEAAKWWRTGSRPSTLATWYTSRGRSRPRLSRFSATGACSSAV